MCACYCRGVFVSDLPSVAPPLPPAAESHYRAFAWVVHEQRLMALLLGAVAAAAGCVWLTVAALRERPAVLVRAPLSLREAAAQAADGTDIAYDQLAFFLQASVPLLYQSEMGRHPWLSLAEGLVSPELCQEAERRLQAHAADMSTKGLSQTLVLTDITDVVADAAAARVAAQLDGTVRVSAAGLPARDFPWRARAVLTANPRARLNPYPYYLLSLETEAPK